MYKNFRKGVFCVVYSLRPLRYLLLHRKLHWKGWEFTKGGKRAMEKLESTVKREVMEETGLNPAEIKKFPISGSFVYDKNASSDWKARGFKYDLFACEVKKGKARLDKKEHDNYKWCTYSQAIRLLKWPNQKRCLKIVNSALK